MNIGLGEIFIIILSLFFLLAPIVIVILSAVFVTRRIRDLEARIAKLEDAKER
jgi:hypothetical protein